MFLPVRPSGAPRVSVPSLRGAEAPGLLKSGGRRGFGERHAGPSVLELWLAPAGASPTVIAVFVDVGLSTDWAIINVMASTSRQSQAEVVEGGNGLCSRPTSPRPLSGGHGLSPAPLQRVQRPGLAAPRRRSPISRASGALTNEEGCAGHTHRPLPEPSQRSPSD